MKIIGIIVAIFVGVVVLCFALLVSDGTGIPEYDEDERPIKPKR